MDKYDQRKGSLRYRIVPERFGYYVDALGCPCCETSPNYYVNPVEVSYPGGGIILGYICDRCDAELEADGVLKEAFCRWLVGEVRAYRTGKLTV